MQRTKVAPKIKAILQKEVNSECPFCGNQDVGTFEIHHIDGNPANSNDIHNLILICPTCHTKIEKCIISYDDVIKRKGELRNKSWKIEFVSAVIENSLCNWEVSNKNELAFFKTEGIKSPNPILNFILINHLSKTVVLKAISVRVKELPRGLSGLGPEPKVLKPLVKYHISLDYRREVNRSLVNPISVPPGQSFMFQVELSVKGYDGLVFPIDGRIVTYFTLKFSNDIHIEIPTLCFNCNDANEPMIIQVLG